MKEISADITASCLKAFCVLRRHMGNKSQSSWWCASKAKLLLQREIPHCQGESWVSDCCLLYFIHLNGKNTVLLFTWTHWLSALRGRTADNTSWRKLVLTQHNRGYDSLDEKCIYNLSAHPAATNPRRFVGHFCVKYKNIRREFRIAAFSDPDGAVWFGSLTCCMMKFKFTESSLNGGLWSCTPALWRCSH